MPNTYPKILSAGTYANYVALATKDANVLYFCTDNGKLFKGEVDFTDSFVSVTSSTLPQTGVAGKIYYESDTATFKTWLGSAYVVIGSPTDASSSDATTISASSDDAHVPTSKNVYLYGQDILAQAVGGTDVVKSVAAGDDAAELVVTQGDDSTSDVVVPGVVVGVAQKANTPGTITVTNSTAASTEDVTLTGVAVSPVWDAVSRVLTIGVAGGTAVECNFGKDIFLDPDGDNHYDSDTQELVLYLNDASSAVPAYSDEATYEVGDKVHHSNYVYEANQAISTPEEWTAAHWTEVGPYTAPTEIRIPVAGLIPVYTGDDTSTADVTVTGTVITADVKVDQHTGNAITIAPDTGEGAELVTGGLRVDLSNYATTTALEAVDDKADANAAEIEAIHTAWGWDSFDPVTP